jgi:N-acetylneuraminic acid mutarotase
MNSQRCVLISLLAICLCSASAQEFPRGKDWKKLAPIPKPGFGMAAVVLDGTLHVLGGSEMDAHQVYDPTMDSWVQKAPLPGGEGIGWGMAAPMSGRIYFFGGGYGKQWRGETKSWVYDPGADRWSAIASMPERRMQGAAVAAGKAIYIIGGHRGLAKRSREEEIRTVYKYDPAKDEYSRAKDMPETGIFIVASSYKGDIYVVPGIERTVKTPNAPGDGYIWADGLMKYNPAKNRWTKLNIERPQKSTWMITQQSSDIAIGPRLLLAGGGTPPDRMRTDLVFYFDMDKGRFEKLGRLPEVRCCAAAGVIGGKLYVVGGFYHDIGQTCPETWAYPFPEEESCCGR